MYSYYHRRREVPHALAGLGLVRVMGYARFSSGCGGVPDLPCAACMHASLATSRSEGGEASQPARGREGPDLTPVLGCYSCTPPADDVRVRILPPSLLIYACSHCCFHLPHSFIHSLNPIAIFFNLLFGGWLVNPAFLVLPVATELLRITCKTKEVTEYGVHQGLSTLGRGVLGDGECTSRVGSLPCTYRCTM